MQAKGKISLVVLAEGDTKPGADSDFEVAAPGVEGYIIGRSDNATEYVPDIDLSPHGAQQLGISRRHAALVRHDELVHVVDLGSMNGTFVNGKQISPTVAYALNDGDQLSLGNLNMIVSHTG